jgi:hypothetical protein
VCALEPQGILKQVGYLERIEVTPDRRLQVF